MLQICTKMNGFKFDFSKIFWGGGSVSPLPRPLLGSPQASPSVWASPSVLGRFAPSTRALPSILGRFAPLIRASPSTFDWGPLFGPQINSWIRPWTRGKAWVEGTKHPSRRHEASESRARSPRVEGTKRPRIKGEARVEDAKRLWIEAEVQTVGKAQVKPGEGGSVNSSQEMKKLKLETILFGEYLSQTFEIKKDNMPVSRQCSIAYIHEKISAVWKLFNYLFFWGNWNPEGTSPTRRCLDKTLWNCRTLKVIVAILKIYLKRTRSQCKSERTGVMRQKWDFSVTNRAVYYERYASEWRGITGKDNNFWKLMQTSASIRVQKVTAREFFITWVWIQRERVIYDTQTERVEGSIVWLVSINRGNLWETRIDYNYYNYSNMNGRQWPQSEARVSFVGCL